jgi:subtilisin family serine protease
MKMYKSLTSVLLVFLIAGCSGGGGDSVAVPQDTTTTPSSDLSPDPSPDPSPDVTVLSDVTPTLIDANISGVSYVCGDKSGKTDVNGKFTCKEKSTVYFTIGGITLGSTTVTTSSDYITPATLYSLSSNDISDERLINFVRLMQSLDSDNNATNGIDINSSTNDSFVGYSLDITNTQTSENDLTTALATVNRTLISTNQALEHYMETLNDTLDVSVDDEPLFEQQWYINYNESFYTQNSVDENANINGSDALSKYSAKGITIAIIDNGLDVNHEELEGALLSTYDLSTKTDDVSHSASYDYHGTAVTGIIGARINSKGIYGIANKANLVFLKFKNSMSDSETIEVFEKAEELGADVINCSWGTYDVSIAVKEKIQDLATNGRDGKGIPIVFSAGNDNKNMRNDEANIPEVISVGSTNKDNDRSNYSNFGAYLDILAPGGEFIGLTTTDPSSNAGLTNSNYIEYDDNNAFVGTSASAPVVSAVIALMLEKNPDLTRVEIENILKNSADKIGDYKYIDSHNAYYGYGKINVAKAFDSF